MISIPYGGLTIFKGQNILEGGFRGTKNPQIITYSAWHTYDLQTRQYREL